MQEIGWIPPAKIDVSLVHGPLRKVATEISISILYYFIDLLVFYPSYIHINERNWSKEYIRFYHLRLGAGSWLVFDWKAFKYGRREASAIFIRRCVFATKPATVLTTKSQHLLNTVVYQIVY